MRSSDVEVARENEIKIGITQELSKALKNVQKENMNSFEQRVYSTETANSVCHCLEAVFLHGLKSSSVTKIASMVGLGQEAISQPGLNFWNFAVKFTHSEVVSQLKHLGQITSEIGLCRAWIRVALNDGLIESYVDAMVADKKTLQYYYIKTAYLRDSEQPEILKTLIHGLMNFEFKLSCNSRVLNEWSYAPLRLSGITSTNVASLPEIKPAASNPKSTSDHPDSDVLSAKTRVSDAEHARKAKHKENLKEQPAVGAPSKSSQYVSSSEFTSKDIEDFKKLASQSGPQSKCASSSKVSCSDHSKLNLRFTDEDSVGQHKGEDSGAANELEESWEEIYKSPVKNAAPVKPFQRLESFQQEIKEKQILEGFLDSDDKEEEHTSSNISYTAPDKKSKKGK